MRHDYLSRIVRINPPSNVPPGLDVQPLSEQAWLDDFEQLAGANESELSLRVYRRRESIFRSMMANHVTISVGGQAGGEDILAQVNEMRPFPNYVEENVVPGDSTPFLSEASAFGPLHAKLNTKWTDDARKENHAVVGKEFYGLPDGYRLIVPDDDARITHPPEGCIGVYAYSLDFGLRFPLDPTLVKILRAFNVCLAQLHPFAVRTLISYIWVCRFLEFPGTLSLCKRVHHLRNSGTGNKIGWFSIYCNRGRLTCHGMPTGQKEWKDRFYWLAVPADFPVARGFVRPRTRLEGVEILDGAVLEERAFEHFSSEPKLNAAGKEVGRLVLRYFLTSCFLFSLCELFFLFLTFFLFFFYFFYFLGRQFLNLEELGVRADGSFICTAPPDPAANGYQILADQIEGSRRSSTRRSGRGGGSGIVPRVSRVVSSTNTGSASTPIRRGQTSRGASHRGALSASRRGRADFEAGLEAPTEDAGHDFGEVAGEVCDQPGRSGSASEPVDIEAEEPPFVQRPGKQPRLDGGAELLRASPSAADPHRSNTSGSSFRQFLEHELQGSDLAADDLDLHITGRHKEFVEKEFLDIRPQADPELAAIFSGPSASDRTFAPRWDVSESESLYGNYPEKGGTLALRMLRGLQLPSDLPKERLYTPGANACQKVMECGNAVRELTEVFIVYQKRLAANVAHMEAQKKRIEELTADLELSSTCLTSANDQLKIVTEERDQLQASFSQAQIDLVTGQQKIETLQQDFLSVEQSHDNEMAQLQNSIEDQLAAAIRDFRRSDEQYALRTQSYDGGWKAASLIVQEKHPDLDWSPIEAAWLAGLHVELLRKKREAEQASLAAGGVVPEDDGVPDHCVENVHPGELPLSDAEDDVGQ
ncbi:uncharacterized protein [Spinacia oleracea]|uniref:Aminotransferase-like plant mobile domain-containing protein n=1 Tax=Spinacia oleracea TaxID=3562 RepID=A0ABM3RRL7_SPIOL|nr:uncharacterized protein LOC130471924 [Spinacia oleracea]